MAKPRKPWESDPEDWKDGTEYQSKKRNGDTKVFRFNTTYEVNSLQVCQFDQTKAIPTLNERLGIFRKKFQEGLFLGYPDECDWLPKKIRSQIDALPHEVMLFIGHPIDNKDTTHFFFLRIGHEAGWTEFERIT